MSGDVRVRLGILPLSPVQLQTDWPRTPEFADQVMSPSFQARIARRAEAAGIDLLLLADKNTTNGTSDDDLVRHANSWFEPVTVMSYLASVTESIGLVATASTSWFEPYTVARTFMSLDHLSGGRAGWNMVSSHPGLEDHNFSHRRELDGETRYTRHAEFGEVVSALWDSWDPDAVIADAQSGRWARPGSVRRIGHRGEHFSVDGPLNVQRSPQGRPIIMSAGGSARFIAHAGRTADAIFTKAPEHEQGIALTSAMRAAEEDAGRPSQSVLVMPGLGVHLPGAEAIDVPAHRNVHGTGAQIAEQLVETVAAGAADGFILMPRRLPEDLDRFAEEVAPELRRLGALAEITGPVTLRARLGLPERTAG